MTCSIGHDDYDIHLGGLATTLYGTRYASTAHVFVLLAAVSCLQSVLHPVWAFVGALRIPLTLLAVSCVALIADVAVVLALLSSSPVWAAALGNSVGQLVSLACYLHLLRRRLHVPGNRLVRALSPFVVVALASAMGGTAAAVTVGSGWPIVAATAFGIGIALLTGWLGAAAWRGMVEDTDLAVVVATFPRFAPIASGLQRLRWVRAGSD